MARPLRRRALVSTTLCSMVALTRAALAQPAPLDEVTLVRRWLERPAVAARARARDAAVDATRAVPSALPTPRLALRREQAFGDDAGFTTTVAGLEADLDLSGRADLLRAAGVERAAIARAEHAAALVEGICRVRRRAVEVEAADAVVGIRSSAQAELEALAAEVRRLVEGRERAAHDADRVALRVELHAQALRDAAVDAAAARAALSALVGPVAGPVAPEPQAPADRADWATRAVEQHPRLRALRGGVEAAKADARVADRWWVPGVGVYGAFRRDTAVEGEAAHGYEAGLTVDLPVVDWGAPARAPRPPPRGPGSPRRWPRTRRGYRASWRRPPRRWTRSSARRRPPAWIRRRPSRARAAATGAAARRWPSGATRGTRSRRGPRRPSHSERAAINFVCAWPAWPAPFPSRRWPRSSRR
ncbi:MAG: TolC family protein [Myxococcales bacterium]|nr:TolC family protein [Myxococcales bacterium]